MRLKHVLHHTDQDRLQGRARGTARRWPQGPLPSVAPCLQLLQGQRSAQGWHPAPPALGDHLWEVLLWFRPMGITEHLWAQALGIWLWQTTGGGVSRQQHGGLRGQSSCLQSTHRKPSQQPALARELGWGASLPNSGLQMRRSPSPAAWSAHIQQRSCLAPLPHHMDHGAQPLLPEKLFRKTGELPEVGSPSSTQAEVGSQPCPPWSVVSACPHLTGRADKNTRKEKKKKRTPGSCTTQQFLSWWAGEWAERVAPRAKSVAPVQPVNLGCRLTRVKTTKSTSGLGDT